MKKVAIFLSCVAAVLFSQRLLESDDTAAETTSRTSNYEHDGQADSPPERSHIGGGSVEWTLMYRSDVFVREFKIDPNRLVVRTSEWDPGEGAWIESQLPYRASFSIVDVDTRGATEFYVLGRAVGGDDVIEQWILEDPVGSYTATRSRAATPFGIASQMTTSSSTIIVGGGPFQADRLSPEMSRHELYRGGEYAAIQALAPDVDGRFLHFAGGEASPGLYTIGLFGLPPAQPTVVVSSATLPQLASCDDLYVHYSSLAGWSWWVNLSDSFDRVLAIDPDNDGIPTAFDLVTDEELLTDYGDWECSRHDWWPL